MASNSLPAEMKALTVKNKTATVSSIPLPQLRPTYLLVKVHSVALNPTDWMHIDGGLGAKPFSIVGCDYAGTVVSKGEEVTNSYTIGEEVFGCCHGSNYNEPYDGCFAEYAVVKGDLAVKVPKNVGMDTASSIGLGAVTVGQGLFQKGKGLGLNLPEQGGGSGEWLLIYGGSTATGTLGIQFAKLAGYKVITTCSPRHNELVKSRGADEVFDYNDPECGSKIRQLTTDKLKYAWDTVSVDTSAKVCGEALSTAGEGCCYGTLLPVKPPRDDIKHSATLMYTVFGEKFDKFGTEFPASKEDFDFAKMWMGLTEKLLMEGKLKAHPVTVEDGGLEGVLQGLKDIKSGKVSGKKLVYRL